MSGDLELNLKINIDRTDGESKTVRTFRVTSFPVTVVRVSVASNALAVRVGA
jgi:hypothetical protein